MPELPEVETIKRGLAKVIVGKTIASVHVRKPKMAALGSGVVSNQRKSSAAKTRKFAQMLKGRKIDSVKRRAKLLIIELEERLTLLVHLKMTGQLIFVRKGENKQVKLYNAPDSPKERLPHKYTHIILQFKDGSRLFFNDLRQFGYMKLVTNVELPNVRELKEFGPEPRLAGLFPHSAREPHPPFLTLQHLIDMAKSRPMLSIKQFLMEPKIVAGIGNIYSDEILYRAGVRPARKVKRISLGEWKEIYAAIPKVLKEAVRAQGSSVGDFFKVDGSEGRYGPKHRVYQRYGKKCKKCGKIIQKIKLGGRTSSYCPKCQK